MPVKKTRTEFVLTASHKHDYKYIYDNFVYVDSKTKGKIKCLDHGFFEQTPNDHLRGRGCPLCKKDKLKLGIDEFIKRAKQTHGDRYNYSKVEYVNARSKVVITCPEHGDFEQLPYNHVSGQNCPKCRYSRTAYKLEDWKQMCPGNPGIFYVLRCWNDEEEFYKVGITCNSVLKRYPSKYEMPYNFEIVKEVYNYDRDVIWNMEKDIKKLNVKQNYIPLIKFNGSSTECFKTLNYESV